MHVLFLCETYAPAPGGLAVAAQRISSNLAPHCASLRRLCLDRQLSPGQARWDEQHQITRLGVFPDEDETLQLVEQYLVHLPEVDLIHCFYGGPLAAAGVAAARRRGLPSLVSLRGNDLDRGFYRPKSSALLRFTLEKASRISCVSREQVTKLKVWFDRSDGCFIPNSVDCDRFYPESSSRRQTPVVACVAEMRWKKGLSVVLEVAAQAPWQTWLVGGLRGAEKAAWKEWRRHHPQADLKVLDYNGDRDWLRGLYSQADLIWLPALWEGMPNALLEAMACARPVLAHAVGGVSDLLGPERGWLLRLDEVDQTHRTIQDILSLSPEQRERVGQSARNWVRQHHQPEQETRAYLELYANSPRI